MSPHMPVRGKSVFSRKLSRKRKGRPKENQHCCVLPVGLWLLKVQRFLESWFTTWWAGSGAFAGKNMQRFEETTSFTVEFVFEVNNYLPRNIMPKSRDCHQLQWLIPSFSKEKFINSMDWEAYWEPQRNSTVEMILQQNVQFCPIASLKVEYECCC